MLQHLVECLQSPANEWKWGRKPSLAVVYNLLIWNFMKTIIYSDNDLIWRELTALVTRHLSDTDTWQYKFVHSKNHIPTCVGMLYVTQLVSSVPKWCMFMEPLLWASGNVGGWGSMTEVRCCLRKQSLATEGGVEAGRTAMGWGKDISMFLCQSK